MTDTVAIVSARWMQAIVGSIFGGALHFQELQEGGRIVDP